MPFVKHQIFDHKKWKKKILYKLLRKKSFRKAFFHSEFFFDQIRKTSAIPKKNLAKLVSTESVVLESYLSRNGNLTLCELLAISTLVSDRKPRRILEIGTFDGNTTLQMALNSPSDAIIHTIDLPAGKSETSLPVLESDLQFILDEEKEERKFEKSKIAGKVKQHFGDSTCYDFSKFTEEGKLDFAFIDGGHSYECVKSDTENVLPLLAEGGCILWHDFTPHFGGVFQFLCELSQKIPLIHIADTNLVIFAPDDREFHE